MTKRLCKERDNPNFLYDRYPLKKKKNRRHKQEVFLTLEKERLSDAFAFQRFLVTLQLR